MIHSIIQILINDTAVKTALGNTKSGSKVRVFPIVADQDEETPYSVVTMTDLQPIGCKEKSYTDRVDFQVITYSEKYEEIYKIDIRIRNALDDFNGNSAGIDIAIWFVSSSDAFDSVTQNRAKISNYRAQIEHSVTN